MSTNTRKKGRRGNKKVNHQKDKLSNLPDEILVKILSCLDTREAVRSGILSTRWKFVWASVPVLKLTQSEFNFKGKLSDGDNRREEARFLNFMDDVLIARKMHCLEKIRISGIKCDPFLVRSWIRAALERDVCELFVYFEESTVGIPCELTNSLFSHNKLVIMKLRVDMPLNFQANSSGFPNLKVLHLDSITYGDDDSLPNLLSSCPILEDLAIFEERGENNLDTLNLISRSVKRLKVDNESLDGESGAVSKMVFDVPAVESLEIYSVRTNDFVVMDLSHLVDVTFRMVEMCSFSNIPNLLRGVSNVKYLKLDYCTVETIELSSSCDVPMFKNLTRLEIYGDDSWEGVDYIDNERPRIVQWELLLLILKWSPVLEHLIFEAHDESSHEYGKASDWDVPACLVSSLKTVEFGIYSEADVERVRYVLLNAKVLEKMTIRSFSIVSKDLKLKLCPAIFEDEKGSMDVTWSGDDVILSFLCSCSDSLAERL